MLRVYTDGACSGNGTEKCFAGCGVWYGKESDPRNLSIVLPVPPHTNQRAELYAVLLAIQSAFVEPEKPRRLLIVSDSKYCVKGISEWLPAWLRNGWKKSNGETVMNLDIWKRVHTCLKELHAQNIVFGIAWTKGHSDDKHNSAADRLATSAIAPDPSSSSSDEEEEVDEEGEGRKVVGEKEAARVTKPVLAVVGSRVIQDKRLVEGEIDRWLHDNRFARENLSIVSGGARGVDSCAAAYARKYALPLQEFRANWTKYGKGAGFMRNHDIIKASTHVLAVWDGKSRGTKHSMGLAEKYGKDLSTAILES